MEKPQIFEEVIFELRTAGYRPVLAHPERYQYLFDNPSWAQAWSDQGVLLQITTGSLGGIYGKGPQKLARNLIDMNIVNFLGVAKHKGVVLLNLFIIDSPNQKMKKKLHDEQVCRLWSICLSQS